MNGADAIVQMGGIPHTVPIRSKGAFFAGHCGLLRTFEWIRRLAVSILIIHNSVSTN
jgi:hypothetical protein